MPYTQGNPGRGTMPQRGADTHAPDPQPTGRPSYVSPVAVLLAVLAAVCAVYAASPGAPHRERALVLERDATSGGFLLALVDREGAPRVEGYGGGVLDDPAYAPGRTVVVTAHGRAPAEVGPGSASGPWTVVAVLLVVALVVQTGTAVSVHRARVRVRALVEHRLARSRTQSWFG
jgi:hypothetical protein